MAWQRVEDKQLAWDLLHEGMLYYKYGPEYYHYSHSHSNAWKPFKTNWFNLTAVPNNYIRVEE